jgi:hypothetical protein
MMPKVFCSVAVAVKPSFLFAAQPGVLIEHARSSVTSAMRSAYQAANLAPAIVVTATVHSPHQHCEAGDASEETAAQIHQDRPLVVSRESRSKKSGYCIRS